MAHININPHGTNDLELHKQRFMHRVLKGMTYSDLSIARKALYNGACYRRTEKIVLIPSDLHLLEEVLEEKIIDMIVEKV